GGASPGGASSRPSAGGEPGGEGPIRAAATAPPAVPAGGDAPSGPGAPATAAATAAPPRPRDAPPAAERTQVGSGRPQTAALRRNTASAPAQEGSGRRPPGPAAPRPRGVGGNRAILIAAAVVGVIAIAII